MPERPTKVPPPRNVERDVLRTLEFTTLTEAKARLSEYVRELRPHEKRVVITVGGKPAAVLVAYEELTTEPTAPPEEVIRIEDWRADRPRREAISRSILARFDLEALRKKGQKRHKEETVRGLRR